MHRDHAQHVRSLFDEAVEREPADRQAYLNQAAPDDPALQAEVLSLLEAHDRAGSFLDPASEPMDESESASRRSLPAIAHYRVLRLLGEGGMGAVFEADQEHPQRRVAIKVIRRGRLTDRRVLRLFEREIRTLARLAHPGIASIYEAAQTEDGEPFFAMELVSGVALDAWVNRERPDLSRWLKLFQQVCQAVHHAHCKGVIHRDLKPSNILVDAGDHPKILDFGLAKLTDADVAATTLETDVGRIQGTLAYMSPEQARGDPQQIDLLTDVYALGVIFYELLTGRPPYETRTRLLPEAVRAICEEPPRRPSSINRSIPRDLETIVLKAIDKDRVRRYHSAAELASDIERFLNNQPVTARAPSTFYQLSKLVSRHKIPAAALASLVFALALFAGWMTTMYRSAEKLRVTAESALAREQTERSRAEAAEAEARTSANTAEQISRFLQDMLSSVDPAVSQGRDTTLLRQLLERASARVETELAQEPRVQATLRQTIGRTYGNLGMLDRAEDQLRAALKIQREAFPGPHADTARALHRLAAVLCAQARYDEAAALFDETLPMLESVFGENHSDYVEALADAAWLRILKGEYANAETMLRRCTEIQNGMRVDNPVGVARVLNDLATVRYHQGDYAEAEQFFSEALSIRRTVLPETHPYLAISLNNLASVLQARGDYCAAEPLYRESLAIRRQLLGDAHPDVANTLNNLGVVLQRQQRWDKAEACLREALDIFRQAHGDRHPAVATAMMNLGNLLKDRGDLVAAREVLENSLAMRRAIYARPHPDIANSLVSVAELHMQQDEAAAAEDLACEALQIREATLPPNHWQIAQAKSMLGSCLTARGKFEDAEPLLLDAHQALQRSRGPADMHTITTLRRLIALYQAWGREDQAAALLRTLSTLENQEP